MNFTKYYQFREAIQPQMQQQQGQQQPQMQQGQGQQQPQMHQQQGQQQPQMQQGQGQGINPRTGFMIDMVNKVLGGNVPKTEEGYDQLGRSQGFLQVMSNMEGWTKLQKHIANIDSKTWNRVPSNVRQELLSKLVTGVSRSQ